LGIVLIGAGIWLYRRNRGEQAEVEEEEAIEAEPEGESSEALMDAIIALDDLYRAGELPEDAYHTRRQELKTRLEKLLQD
jgi:hypothetical protein